LRPDSTTQDEFAQDPLPFDRGITLSGLLPRIICLAILFGAELLVLSFWLDGERLPQNLFLVGLIRQWGAAALRYVVTCSAVFATFAYLRSQPLLDRLSEQLRSQPVRPILIIAHLFCLLGFAALSNSLYGNSPSNLLAACWLVVGTSAILFGALAAIPFQIWVALLRGTGALWLYAAATAGAADFATHPSRQLWEPAVRMTFRMVRWLLIPFLTAISGDAATGQIGSPRFAVLISPECSGLEGAGLMLAFSLVWLWLFRHEMRFPNALLLPPMGVTTIFLMNAVRIAALILIGDAGAPGIAEGGFHSQAGWILFNLVALSLCVVSLHSPWFALQPGTGIAAVLTNLSAEAPRRSEVPAAPYFLPLVTLLAAGMVAHAASSDFEWLYPLRFVAASAALWTFRKKYSEWSWRPEPMAFLIGIGVFILWIVPDLLQTTPATGARMPAALAAAPGWLAIGWICVRVLAASVTVPLSEELAFRGYLLRRFTAMQFENLPPRAFTWFALGLSSFLFGLMHGGRWLEGTIAGAAYAFAYLRRGRLVDAVVAHGVTNALLAAYVLTAQRWYFW
jgi:exosortase E/protease (VPEID-CTERM system)